MAIWPPPLVGEYFSPESRGRNQVQTNKDQQYMRSKVDLPSKSTRNSPDSQRTISETHRYNRRDGAGRRHHSPRQQSRMEWQPTREPEKRGDEQMAPSPNRMNVREAARDSEDERGRKLKGKATAENTSDKETNLAPIRAASGILKIFDPVQTELPVNQAIMEKEKEIVTSPERVISLRSSVETGAPPLNRPSLEELYKPTDDEQDMTEEELKEFEEQSGLAVSMQKTSFFASGTTEEEINTIQASTGMPCGNLPFRYQECR